MQREGSARIDTLLAMGALIGQLFEAQQRARGQFAEVFAGFDSPANAERFAGCFVPARTRKEEQ
jgi:hypothetical protein